MLEATIRDYYWAYEVTTSGEHWVKTGEGPDDYEEGFAFNIATLTGEGRRFHWKQVRDENGERRTYPSPEEALKAGVAYLVDHLDEIKHTL